MIIGIIGLALLAIGWAYETFSVIKEKRKINVNFAIIYTLGSLCLFIYSFQIKDYIFMIINGLITISSFISLVFSLKK